MKHSRKKIHLHKGWLIGILVTVVVIGSLIAFAAVLAIALPPNSNSPYCDGIDPTECTIEVNIHNDMDTTSILKQCVDDVPCSSFANTITLVPNSSHSVNGSTDNTPQPWMVFDQQGKAIGCLNLSYTKYENAPVNESLSKMLSCQEVKDAITKFKKDYHAW